MNVGEIYISEVIRIYQNSGMTSHSGEFALRYIYEKDGKLIKRDFPKCRRRIAKTLKRSESKNRNGLQKEINDASKLHIEFWDGRSWIPRKLFIHGCTRFNGLLIKHEY